MGMRPLTIVFFAFLPWAVWGGFSATDEVLNLDSPIQLSDKDFDPPGESEIQQNPVQGDPEWPDGGITNLPHQDTESGFPDDDRPPSRSPGILHPPIVVPTSNERLNEMANKIRSSAFLETCPATSCCFAENYVRYNSAVLDTLKLVGEEQTQQTLGDLKEEYDRTLGRLYFLEEPEEASERFRQALEIFQSSTPNIGDEIRQSLLQTLEHKAEYVAILEHVALHPNAIGFLLNRENPQDLVSELQSHFSCIPRQSTVDGQLITVAAGDADTPHCLILNDPEKRQSLNSVLFALVSHYKASKLESPEQALEPFLQVLTRDLPPKEVRDSLLLKIRSEEILSGDEETINLPDKTASERLNEVRGILRENLTRVERNISEIINSEAYRFLERHKEPYVQKTEDTSCRPPDTHTEGGPCFRGPPRPEDHALTLCKIATEAKLHDDSNVLTYLQNISRNDPTATGYRNTREYIELATELLRQNRTAPPLTDEQKRELAEEICLNSPQNSEDLANQNRIHRESGGLADHQRTGEFLPGGIPPGAPGSEEGTDEGEENREGETNEEGKDEKDEEREEDEVKETVDQHPFTANLTPPPGSTMPFSLTPDYSSLHNAAITLRREGISMLASPTPDFFSTPMPIPNLPCNLYTCANQNPFFNPTLNTRFQPLLAR